MARVLVVEDDADLRDYLTEALTDAGYEVHSAPDGAQGLRAVQEAAPDLLVTDVMMPTKDGLELLLELSRLNSPPKTLVISGAPGQWRVLETASRLGANRTLAKPFTRGDLLRAIEAVLGG